MKDIDSSLEQLHHVAAQLERLLRALNSVLMCADQEVRRSGLVLGSGTMSQVATDVAEYEHVAIVIGEAAAQASHSGRALLDAANVLVPVAEERQAELAALLDSFAVAFSAADTTLIDSRARLSRAVEQLRLAALWRQTDSQVTATVEGLLRRISRRVDAKQSGRAIPRGRPAR